MGKHITCDLDSFAIALGELVADIPPAAAEKVSAAVEKTTRKGVRAVKGQASKGGVHSWSGEYVGGFASHVKRGVVSSGEIGNKAKPGLVHLLEKGHATPAGHRTRAFPHMAPAFEEISPEFVEAVEDAVSEAIA